MKIYELNNKINESASNLQNNILNMDIVEFIGYIFIIIAFVVSIKWLMSAVENEINY